MRPKQKEELEIFDAFSQPVLLVRDNIVAHANTAARQAGVAPGRAASIYVQEDARVRLGAYLARTEQFSYAGGTLYVAEPFWAGIQIGPEMLQQIAQAIRAPLTNLFALSSALSPALEELERPMLNTAFAGINRGFYQLLHLACNLSDAPAAMQGNMTATGERVELCALLQELYEKAQPLCALCSITLSCQLPERPIVIWGERAKLTRAVYQLLEQAMKHTAKGGTIALRLTQMERFAVIEVQDSGEAEERMRRMREQLTGAAQTGAQNTVNQLGLTVARAIARAHGGTMVLSSDANGVTTAISLSLRIPEQATQTLRSPTARFDYTGGYRQELVELADCLPSEVYTPVKRK